ncbi:MAG: hypothetical protein HZB41_04165 [Ignavibacteriae bacterium]|nr:hypothetical protein [Ignavibacteriota bacterium]
MPEFIRNFNIVIKNLLFFIIIISSSDLYSQPKNEIQIVSPADMQALTAVNVDFQWLPPKEKDIKFKIYIARLVDTGISVRNYPSLADAPKSYFKKGFKIIQESLQNNTYKIDNITTFLNDKSPKEKNEPGKRTEGIGNMPESPISFYAWQVEAYKNNKLLASSSINIFLWNSMTAPEEIYMPELIEPVDGAVINPENVKFCWKSGPPEIKYQLNFIYQEKDTNINTIQSGPFDYLTLTQEKKTLDSLIYIIDSVEIPFFEQVSSKLEDNAGNIKTYKDKFSLLKSKLQKKAKSSGITLTEKSCEMPDSCESEPVCDKLRANDYLHRDLFKNRYKCLLDKIHLQNMNIQNLLTIYSKLQRKWVGEDNRTTDFGVYNIFVNFINILCDGKLTEIEGEALEPAYSIINCLDKIQDQLVNLSKCRDYTKNCVTELNTESINYKNDLLKQKNGVELLWRNDSLKIDSDIGLAVWESIGQLKTKTECCTSDSGEIILEFPSNDEAGYCNYIFSSSLNKYLGDRICFLKIKINYDCKSNNASWNWTGPEKHRLAGCYQMFDKKITLADLTEDGNGKTKCFPNNETERNSLKKIFNQNPKGKWMVEASSNNLFAASSQLRDIFTKPITKKQLIKKSDNRENPVKSCNCIMRLLFNRVGVPPLNQKRAVMMGVPAEIAIDGRCQGDCIELEKIIKVINPDIYFADIKFPAPPVLNYGSVLNYNFPYCGKYTIYGTTLCTDSISNTDKFYAEVNCSLTNLQQNSDANIASPDCPSCGCISMYYMYNKIKASIINNFLYLGKPQKLDLIYESHCFGNCSADKEIEWQLTDPDGKKSIKKGKNLTELKYNFNKKGKYKICIVEKTICNGKPEECSIFFTVDTE